MPKPTDLEKNVSLDVSKPTEKSTHDEMVKEQFRSSTASSSSAPSLVGPSGQKQARFERSSLERSSRKGPSGRDPVDEQARLEDSKPSVTLLVSRLASRFECKPGGLHNVLSVDFRRPGTGQTTDHHPHPTHSTVESATGTPSLAASLASGALGGWSVGRPAGQLC